MRFEEYGLGACELLEASEGGALPAEYIIRELGLSDADYRKLLEYLVSQGPVKKAMSRDPALMWGMQKTRTFYGWWEEKKEKYLPLTFDSKRLARSTLQSKPDLSRLRRPWESLGWEYGERYLGAAAELIQEGIAQADRVSDQDLQFENLVLTQHGAQVIRRDFRLGVAGPVRRDIPSSAEAVHVQTRDFSFVADQDLRTIIERDYEEMQQCLRMGAYKSTVVMCGSVMEALLLDALLKDAARARASPKAPKDAKGRVVKDLRRWQLDQMIEVAADLLIIRPETDQIISQGVRQYRNLIHPAVEIRKQLAPEQEEANAARSALALVVKNLRSTA